MLYPNNDQKVYLYIKTNYVTLNKIFDFF